MAVANFVKKKLDRLCNAPPVTMYWIAGSLTWPTLNTTGPADVTVPRSLESPKTGQLLLMARKFVSWVLGSFPLEVNVPRTTISWPDWNVVLATYRFVITRDVIWNPKTLTYVLNGIKCRPILQCIVKLGLLIRIITRNTDIACDLQFLQRLVDSQVEPDGWLFRL